MLLLVLILVLIAFGLLVVALLSGSVLWAWVSVGVSVAAAVVLLIDWLQRRSAVRAGDRAGPGGAGRRARGARAPAGPRAGDRSPRSSRSSRRAVPSRRRAGGGNRASGRPGRSPVRRRAVGRVRRPRFCRSSNRPALRSDRPALPRLTAVERNSVTQRHRFRGRRSDADEDDVACGPDAAPVAAAAQPGSAGARRTDRAPAVDLRHPRTRPSDAEPSRRRTSADLDGPTGTRRGRRGGGPTSRDGPGEESTVEARRPPGGATVAACAAPPSRGRHGRGRRAGGRARDERAAAAAAPQDAERPDTSPRSVARRAGRGSAGRAGSAADVEATVVVDRPGRAVGRPLHRVEPARAEPDAGRDGRRRRPAAAAARAGSRRAAAPAGQPVAAAGPDGEPPEEPQRPRGRRARRGARGRGRRRRRAAALPRAPAAARWPGGS